MYPLDLSHYFDCFTAKYVDFECVLNTILPTFHSIVLK